MSKLLFLFILFPALTVANVWEKCQITEVQSSTPSEAEYGIEKGAKLTIFDGEYRELALDIGNVQLREENGDRIGAMPALVIDHHYAFSKRGAEFYYFLQISNLASPSTGRLLRAEVGQQEAKVQVATLVCN